MIQGSKFRQIWKQLTIPRPTAVLRGKKTSYKAVCLKYQSFKVLRIVVDSWTVELDVQPWREPVFTAYLQGVCIPPVGGWWVL